ncbi:hypothetical protein U1Q18_044242, partial [Sarracenia purpurea var. burkii]
RERREMEWCIRGWRGLLRCSPEKMLGSLMEVEGELADGAGGKGMPQECTGGCDVGLTGWRRQGVEDGGRCAGKRHWAATSLPASEVDMDKLLCYGLEALSGSKQKKEMNMAWEMFGQPKNIGFVCLFEDKVGGGATDDLL